MRRDIFLMRPNGFGSVRVALVARTRVVPDPVDQVHKVIVVMKDKSEILWQRCVSEQSARSAHDILVQELNNALH